MFWSTFVEYLGTQNQGFCRFQRGNDTCFFAFGYHLISWDLENLSKKLGKSVRFICLQDKEARSSALVQRRGERGPKWPKHRGQELSPSLLDWFSGLLMPNFHGLSLQMKPHCVRIAVRPAVYPSFRRSITGNLAVSNLIPAIIIGTSNHW